MSLMWIFSVHSSQVCNNLNLCKWKHTHNLLQNQPTIRTNIVIFLPWHAHFAFQSSNMRFVCCENHTDCVLYVRHKQNSRIIAKFVEVLAYLQDTTCWSFSACYWIICMKAIHLLCTWYIRTCFIRWLATSECSKYVQQIVPYFCSKSQTLLQFPVVNLLLPSNLEHSPYVQLWAPMANKIKGFVIMSLTKRKESSHTFLMNTPYMDIPGIFTANQKVDDKFRFLHCSS